MNSVEQPRPRFPWITAGLCAAMIGIHALGATEAPAGTPSSQLDLLRAGAKSRALVADAGESWRVLAFHLVHTSWIHLAFNLAFLFPVGGALEVVVRRTDYALLLMALALGSGLTSLVLTPEVSAGASGVVFGLLGAAVTFGLRTGPRLAPPVRRYFGLWVVPFLAAALLAGVGNPYLDHASHLGGLIAGLVLGASLRLRSGIPCATDKRDVALVLAATGVVATILAVTPRALAGGQAWDEYVLPQEGLRLHVPSGWRPGYGPLGTRAFRGAGGLVQLEVEPGPPAETEAGWYERLRLAPLQSAGMISRPRLLQRRALRLRHGQAVLRRYRFIRGRTPVIRDVVFMQPAQTAKRRVVISMETPQEWAGKYAETKRAVLGSLSSATVDPSAPRAGQTHAAAAIP